MKTSICPYIIFFLSTFLLFTITPIQITNAQWMRPSGLTGYVHAFAVSGDVLFAATDTSGVYISTDKGIIWKAIKNGLTSKKVHTLCVLGTNLYAGTDEGVFLTTNRGIEWESINNGLPPVAVNVLIPIGSNLFAGTIGKGIFLSTNGGNIWQEVNNDLTKAVKVTSLVYRDNNVFAGTDGDGVFRSSDKGRGWEKVNNGLNSLQVLALAFKGTKLFAGTNGKGIFVSEDYGTSWSISEKNSHPFVFCFITDSASIFCGTFLGMQVSTDDGQTWNECTKKVAYTG